MTVALLAAGTVAGYLALRRAGRQPSAVPAGPAGQPAAGDTVPAGPSAAASTPAGR